MNLYSVSCFAALKPATKRGITPLTRPIKGRHRIKVMAPDPVRAMRDALLLFSWSNRLHSQTYGLGSGDYVHQGQLEYGQPFVYILVTQEETC